MFETAKLLGQLLKVLVDAVHADADVLEALRDTRSDHVVLDFYLGFEEVIRRRHFISVVHM